MDIITVSKSTKEYTDYPLHQHACWEILFSIRGHGTIRIDEDIMPFHEGSIFVIPPNHPHCKKSPTGYIDGCIFAQNIQMDDNHFWSVEDDYEKTLFTLFDIAYYAQERKGTYSKKVIDSVGEAVYSVLLELRSQQDAYDQSVDRFIHLLIDIVAKGGNLALNVAPGPDGRFPAPAVARMDAMGEWLAKNGKAIYGTRVLKPYRTGDWAFTAGKKGERYAIRLWQERERGTRTLKLPESFAGGVTAAVRVSSGRVSPVAIRNGVPTFELAADDRADAYADAFELK